jgi:hypothetical protein
MTLVTPPFEFGEAPFDELLLQANVEREQARSNRSIDVLVTSSPLAPYGPIGVE